MKITILTGDDYYRKQQHLTDGAVKFKSDATLEQVLESLRPSLFSQGEPIIWVNPNPSQIEELIRSAPDSAKITILLDKLDKRTKAGKKLKSYQKDFSLPKPWEWGKMQKRAREVFPNLSADIVDVIATHTEGHTGKLEDLKSKLSLYPEISTELVEAALPDAIPQMGDLAYKLIRKDEAATPLLESILESENEFKVLAILQYKIRDWLKVKRGISHGLNPYRVKHLKRDVVDVSEEDLSGLLELLVHQQQQIIVGSERDFLHAIRKFIG